MIGVDTNVLVRLFVNDDPVQHVLAKAFFAARTRDDPAFVSMTCAVEFIWVLTRSFRQPPDRALGLLRLVLTSEDAVVEGSAEVREAMQIALEQGADFADAVIMLAGARAGASHSVTFDRGAARTVPGMDLLT